MQILIEGQTFNLPDTLPDSVNNDDSLRTLLTPYFPMAANAKIIRKADSIEIVKQPGRLGSRALDYLDSVPDYSTNFAHPLEELTEEDLKDFIREAEETLVETNDTLLDIERVKPHFVPFPVFM